VEKFPPPRLRFLGVPRVKVYFPTLQVAFTLPAGTVLTAISNTAETLISGAFANLADGVNVTTGSNT
jgi:hypothetical protein